MSLKNLSERKKKQIQILSFSIELVVFHNPGGEKITLTPKFFNQKKKRIYNFFFFNITLYFNSSNIYKGSNQIQMLILIKFGMKNLSY